jgi:hypothetical protein
MALSISTMTKMGTQLPRTVTVSTQVAVTSSPVLDLVQGIKVLVMVGVLAVRVKLHLVQAARTSEAVVHLD